ncbi:MAG: DUF1611 domain-containing protein, partial [Nitrospinaceae bacterium]
IILQHPPARKFRCDFPRLAMPSAESEIKLIETIAKTKVVAITLSHEDMDDHGILKVIEDYEKRFQLPTTDVLNYGCQKIVQALSNNFPKLKYRITRENHKISIN